MPEGVTKGHMFTRKLLMIVSSADDRTGRKQGRMAKMLAKVQAYESSGGEKVTIPPEVTAWIDSQGDAPPPPPPPEPEQPELEQSALR